MSNDYRASGGTVLPVSSVGPSGLPVANATARFCIGVDGGGSGTRVLIAPYAPSATPAGTARSFVSPHPTDVSGGVPVSKGVVDQYDLPVGLAWPLRGAAGPSGLGLGIERAWDAITRACTDAFSTAGITWQWPDCVMACGLAGDNHAPWRDAFIASAPPLRGLSVFSDAFTTWVGALSGGGDALDTTKIDGTMGRESGKQPGQEGRGRARSRAEAPTRAHDNAQDEIIAGVVIALGTGSIGCAMDAEHGWRTVGGFGFPAGDEASGAWFGLQAAGYAQRALDGRVPIDALARALIDAMGLPERTGNVAAAPCHADASPIAKVEAGPAHHSAANDPNADAPSHGTSGLASGRDRLQAWLTSANQTDYASLMRVLVDFPDHPTVRSLRMRAAADVDAMIDALDPGMTLPVVLAGSVAPWLADALASRHRSRLRPAVGDAATGALRMAQGWIKQP
ncbi:glucosamine kinase [Robbsia andropogonis]